MRDWTAHNAAALVLLLASAMLALGAARGEGVARLPEAPSPGGSAGAAGGRAAAPRGVPEPEPAILHRRVLETVARNPFRPERARPAGRFRLPGSGPPAQAAPAPAAPAAVGAAVSGTPALPPPRPPVPQFRLVGLAAMAGGKGIAAIQASGAPPRVVNVGDSISGFRLVAVSPTEATLRGADTTLVIRSSSPAP